MFRILACLCALSGLSVWSCTQAPDLRPRIERVTPDRVAQGQARYVALHGVFTPVASWPAAGRPDLDLDFSVRIGGQACDQVVVAGPDLLLVRVPADLETGCLDVEVAGPDGTTGRLPGGLCVGPVSDLQIVHACLLADHFSLCAFDAAGSSADYQVMVDDLVPTLDEETGFFQADASLRAYAFSPDDRWLSLLRDRMDVDGQTRLRSLVLVDLSGASEERTLATLEQPLDAQGAAEDSVLSAPAWSGDSRTLVWLEAHRRLMRFVLEGEPPFSGQAERVFQLDDADSARLYYPDVDPAGRSVLLTRARGDAAAEDGDLSMLLVPLAGGPARRLDTHPAGEMVHDGPGVFLPSGAGVLFLSDRLGLEVPALSLSMEKATNLYTLDLPGGSVRAIGDPVGALLMGLPEVSPDGRRALIPGMLNDLSGSGLDILLADLDSGAMRHTFRDPVPFCYPDLYQECTPGDHQGCCGQTNDGYLCCSPDAPLACPSLDSLAAFTPDSANFIANMIPYRWTCVDTGDRRAWTFDMVPRLSGLPYVFLLFSVRDEAADPPWSVWIFDNYDLVPLAPVYRQTVALVP